MRRRVRDPLFDADADARAALLFGFAASAIANMRCTDVGDVINVGNFGWYPFVGSASRSAATEAL